MQLLVQELSPERCSVSAYGIVTLVTSSYVLQAFRAASGVQFFVTADLNTQNLSQFLAQVYILYSDYVMKNPFYQLDMFIKIDKWDLHLTRLVQKHNTNSNTNANSNTNTNNNDNGNVIINANNNNNNSAMNTSGLRT